MIFILNSSYGALVYEQTYAKQIVLLIDGAKTNTDLGIDMTNAIEVARKYISTNKAETSDEILKRAIIIDKEKGTITVSLSGRGGYSYKYFSGYDVNLETAGVILKINVREKENA